MHKHHDVDRFNEWAPSYEQHWLQNMIMGPVQETVLDLALEQVPRPAAILDVGCGTGRLLRSAAVRFPGARLEGIDPAEGMVKQAQSMLPAGLAIRFQQASAEAMPFPDNQFDLVFSTMAFHHWADQGAGLHEVARVLAPEGHLVLADFIGTGLVARLSMLLRLHRFLDRRRLDATLASAGFTVLAERRVPRTAGNIPVLSIGPVPRP